VRTEDAGPYVRLSFCDNGPGIPADRLTKIFEPLFTTKSFGVGLGLPTVRQIVEQHGGTIDVESVVDQGTVFTIWLPRQAAPAATEAMPDQAQVA
jgi:signal transduction histidine kinase